jgi:hypothetical protein
MASAGLAITLSYLALERFRYRRDVEATALRLFEAYQGNAKLDCRDSLEHVNEIGWLCRRHSNGFKSKGLFAFIYRVFFRSHGDIIAVALLAIFSAVILVLGVAGGSDIIQPLTSRWAILGGFGESAAALLVPAVSVLAGRRCCRWGIERAIACDRQIAVVLMIGAQEAAIGPPDACLPDSPQPEPTRPKRGFFGRLLGK